jgi:hypothetical protein
MCTVRTASTLQWALIFRPVLILLIAMFFQDPAASQEVEKQVETPVRNDKALPCQAAAQMFPAEEYSGPGKRIIHFLVRKPEITTAQPTQDSRAGWPCTLKAKQKFRLMIDDTFEPIALAGVAVESSLDHSSNSDPTYGLGAQGYGKRLGARFADGVSASFFSTYLYPTLFRQDSRYFRTRHGSPKGRLGAALSYSFVAYSDKGHKTVNASRWLGASSSVALANLYHPDRERGFAPAAQRVGIKLATQAGFDVIKEFWPDIVRTLRLPFRPQKPAASPRQDGQGHPDDGVRQDP